MWGKIHTTLGFFNCLAQAGNIFSTNPDFGWFLALPNWICLRLVQTFEENFFHVHYHFIVEGYGHIPAEQTNAMERQALVRSLVIGSPGQLSIDHDPVRKTFFYPSRHSLRTRLSHSGRRMGLQTRIITMLEVIMIPWKSKTGKANTWWKTL